MYQHDPGMERIRANAASLSYLRTPKQPLIIVIREIERAVIASECSEGFKIAQIVSDESVYSFFYSTDQSRACVVRATCPVSLSDEIEVSGGRFKRVDGMGPEYPESLVKEVSGAMDTTASQAV